MTKQLACTLCGAGGHTAAQCHWRTDATLDKIRAAGLTIDGDNAYKRDLLDCVVGALAFGFQGRRAPEESHWLHRFWEIGNAEREARAALAQPSPAGEYGDAYQGAREDLAIWKRRALEAEQALREEKVLTERLGNALNDENGPTFMGEPSVKQQSPAPELERPEAIEFDWPEYHAQGMGCGLEDRGITNRYDAMQHGWDCAIDRCAEIVPDEPLMTVAQHDRIVGALRAEVARLDDGWKVANGIALLNAQERDATLAWAAELVVALERAATAMWNSEANMDNAAAEAEEAIGNAKSAAPVAQAGQVPQAWLDVQAERRRQVEDEGWAPEHDDEHGGGQMARAAACYALAGSCAPNDETAALLVSLAWPWAPEWWKPTENRRDLVKSAALIFAELERLDRAAAPAQGGE